MEGALVVGYRWSCPSANRGTSPTSPPIPSVFGGFFVGYIRRARIAMTPPGYCSGVVVTFLEPHREHFMCLPTSATGMSPSSGKLSGSRPRSPPNMACRTDAAPLLETTR